MHNIIVSVLALLIALPLVAKTPKKDALRGKLEAAAGKSMQKKTAFSQNAQDAMQQSIAEILRDPSSDAPKGKGAFVLYLTADNRKKVGFYTSTHFGNDDFLRLANGKIIQLSDVLEGETRQANGFIVLEEPYKYHGLLRVKADKVAALGITALPELAYLTKTQLSALPESTRLCLDGKCAAPKEMVFQKTPARGLWTSERFNGASSVEFEPFFIVRDNRAYVAGILFGMLPRDSKLKEVFSGEQHGVELLYKTYWNATDVVALPLE